MQIPLSVNSYAAEEYEAVAAVMQSGDLTMGARCREFEVQFSKALGVRHAVFVNSGSSANLLAIFAIANSAVPQSLSRLRLDKGSEVIVPAVTWPTTVWPIVQAGAIPVFVDCDPTTLQLHISELDSAISDRTRAVVATHVLGNHSDMNAILSFSQRHGLWLIEDTCESLGTLSDNKQLGTFGDLGTFSFFFSHHISTIEGGMVVTQSDEMANLLRCLRSHGWSRELKGDYASVEKDSDIDSSFIFVNTGFNVRPTEINGALGLVQLRKWAEFNEARSRVAAFWDHALQPLIRNGEISLMRTPESSEVVHFAYPVLCRDRRARDSLRTQLEESGIETRPIIAGNLCRQPAMQNVRHRIASELTGADQIASRGLYWGLYPQMEEAQMEYVVTKVFEAFDR
tara:strand:- start:96 stop:1292 length:1197 start_codon:yes stop_codon:yes gene_type:complete